MLITYARHYLLRLKLDRQAVTAIEYSLMASLVAMVIVGLGAAAGLMWFSWYGREFWQFALAARIELRKVVWPEREETIKTTYVVFIFAIVMGLFFWGLDWVLTWLTRLLSGQSG